MVLNGANPFPKELVDQYYKNRWWLGITLGEMLDRSCDVYPHKEAFVAGEVRLTYRELREYTDRAAIAFLELGIEKRDRILLQIPNWPEFVYSYYGLHKIGAIPVMCLPRFSQRELKHFWEITQAKAWIVPVRYEKVDYLPMIDSLRFPETGLKYILAIKSSRENEQVPEGTFSFNRLLNKIDLRNYPKDYLHFFRPDPEEVCHLMPTGGSTGLPKIVPRTHNDYLCNAEFRAKAWERSPRDITLIATPVTHNMAIEVSMNPTFLSGGKVVMISSTRPKEILETIQREKVTTTILVVAQLQQIIDNPSLDQYDLSSLKVISASGSNVPANLIRRVYEKIGCKFYNAFGMSEGPCIQTRYDDRDEIVIHTVGWPICPYDEFKLIDATDNELPQGKEGELVARGPCIFRGYYKADSENREAFTPDGFFRTGDIAKFDAERHLIITGRKKDIIIRGGENISAREVEELICNHPKVKQVAAVGMPDSILGERICVFVELKEDTAVSFEEIISYLKEKKVSVLYLPERIEVVDQIPLTNVGKVDKNRLREEIKDKLEKEGKI